MARTISEMRAWVEEARRAYEDAEKAGLERTDGLRLHRLRTAYYARLKRLQNAERAPLRQFELLDAAS